MRPGIKKEVLRNSTNYKLARLIVDGFLWAEVIVLALVVGLALMVGALERLELEGWANIVAIVCGVLLVLASAFLQRELLQAFLDIADAQVERNTPNPFKE